MYSTLIFHNKVVEFGFLQDSYTISEQPQLSDAMICVMINQGELEKEVVISFNVIDITTEGIVGMPT